MRVIEGWRKEAIKANREIGRVVLASRTNRAREVADVRPTLHSTSARGWGGHDLRPQLVQPCRRRAGDGVLHRGAGQALSADDPWGRESHRRQRDHSTEILP